MLEVAPISSDGSGDDWPQLQAALQTPGEVVVLKPGIYNARYAPLTMNGIGGVRLVGEGYPVIRSRSAFEGTAGLPQARAGLYAENCPDLTIEGVAWEGDTEPNLALHVGPAVYLRGCTHATLRDLRQINGAALFQQDPLATDRGLLVTRCKSYGARRACIPGPHSRIEQSSWELPTDVSYDRLGDFGSSHAIYLYAGRDYVTVDACEFVNIRTTSVKASGTALPIKRTQVTNSRFLDCGGGVLVGADGATDADHTDALIENNFFADCANRGTGWFTGAAISVLGSMGTVVRGNKLTYSRASVTPAACKGIEATRYYTGSVGGRLCEDVLIADNEIIARVTGVNPGSVLTHGIYLYEAARPRVERNRIQAAAGVGLTVGAGSSLVRVRDLSLVNVVSAVQVYTTSSVEVKGTRLVRGPYTSTNPQIRFTACTGIESRDNDELVAGGRLPLVEFLAA